MARQNENSDIGIHDFYFLRQFQSGFVRQPNVHDDKVGLKPAMILGTSGKFTTRDDRIVELEREAAIQRKILEKLLKKVG